MIIKKLAVPFINEKLLAQAEHCYIATAGISDAGFDFVRTRLPLKSKIDIVTGLDAPTSPSVLRRIWRHYHDRITLHIYTRNFFHPNVYILDLPFRKCVAFLGSGNLTLEGLKDNEEIFYKITDAKEIEILKSWFTGYYEFAEPVTEGIIEEYEGVYPFIKQRQIISQQEKRDVIDLTTGGFSWDAIKFKNQYFKLEDYQTFSIGKISLTTPEIYSERENVKSKLLELHALIKPHLSTLRLHEDSTDEQLVSSLDPASHAEAKVRAMWISYGRNKAALNNYSAEAKLNDFMTLRIVILKKEVQVLLVPGIPGSGKVDREYFREKMNDAIYRNTFFKLLTSLGAGYWIEVAGDKKSVETFQHEDGLWEFTKPDDWRYYSFTLGKSYLPSDPSISSAAIAQTIEKEFDKLIILYRHLKDSDE